MSFFSKLEDRIRTKNTLLCIGLDPRVPEGSDPYEFITARNRTVIEETAEYTACYKPNIAFYEAFGIPGMKALEETMKMIPDDIPVIIDAKRNDIGATAEAYTKAIFNVLGSDAVTLNPYMGLTSARPWLEYRDKGYFMLCRTSNPGAADIQELIVTGPSGEKTPLFLHLAKLISSWSGRIGLVVGGNDPASLKKVRELLPDVWLLAPGIGTQGGSIEEAITAGIRADGTGILPMVGRAVYNDDDPGMRAKEYRDALNAAREKAAASDTVSAGRQSLKDRELKKDICRGLVETNCFQLGEFTLKSGKKSPFYIDMRKIQSNPAFLSKVGAAYAGLCSKVAAGSGAASIAGIPLAAVPLATAASLQSGLPLIYPRMSVKSHGTGKLVEGSFKEGDRTVLLDDLITTGLSKIEAADILKKAGIIVEDLVVLLERGKQGREDMEKAGIRLHSFLQVHELFDYLLSEGIINADKHKELMEFAGQ